MICTSLPIHVISNNTFPAPRYDDGGFLPPEPEPCDEEPEAYVTNLSYYHLVPFETDILE